MSDVPTDDAPAPRGKAPAVLDALREATGAAHARLDASVPIGPASLDLERYAALLERHLAAQQAVERALDPWAAALDAAGVDLEARRKLPLLRRDLAHVHALLRERADDPRDAAADGADAIEPPVEHVALALPDLAAVWGALYVVEGATLGARYITRRLLDAPLHTRHGLTVEAGLAYFAGYGGETGRRWHALVAALDAFDRAHPTARPAVLAAARETFAFYQRVLVGDDDGATTASSVDATGAAGGRALR